jgi:hypothetical protein
MPDHHGRQSPKSNHLIFEAVSQLAAGQELSKHPRDELRQAGWLQDSAA